MRNQFSPKWSAWVKNARISHGWSRRNLAHAANVDASLLTLIERDGHIPLRPRVEAIGSALGDREAALKSAGMLTKPEAITRGELRWLDLKQRLPEDAVNALELLSNVSKARQEQGLQMLAAYATGVLKVKQATRKVAIDA